MSLLRDLVAGFGAELFVRGEYIPIVEDLNGELPLGESELVFPSAGKLMVLLKHSTFMGDGLYSKDGYLFLGFPSSINRSFNLQLDPSMHIMVNNRANRDYAAKALAGAVVYRKVLESSARIAYNKKLAKYLQVDISGIETPVESYGWVSTIMDMHDLNEESVVSLLAYDIELSNALSNRGNYNLIHERNKIDDTVRDSLVGMVYNNGYGYYEHFAVESKVVYDADQLCNKFMLVKADQSQVDEKLDVALQSINMKRVGDTKGNMFKPAMWRSSHYSVTAKYVSPGITLVTIGGVKSWDY